MKADKTAGLVLIVGSVGYIVTMAFHPSGGGVEKIVGNARLGIGIHTLGIFSIGLMVLGFLRFARAMGPDRLHADAGFVAYLFAAAAATLAAIGNGIVTPALAERALGAEPVQEAIWNLIFTYNFQLDTALTKVFIVGTLTATLIWSLGMLQIGGGSSWLGGVGIAVGAVSLLAFFSGHIHNNVHDVGMFVFGLSAWTVALGVSLCRSAGTSSAA